MSKFDTNVINNIKMLSLDMIKEAGSGNAKVALSMSQIFYNLFLNHLEFKSNNPNWINRDRIIVNNKFLPIMYSTLHMFGNDISLDSLKEYKKFNSITNGFANPATTGIDIGSIANGDVISSSVGISLGERYLEALVKEENPKCELINFHTYCVCTMDDLMSGIAYESLSFASTEKLNKLIILCNKDDIGRDSSTKETYNENLIDRFIALDFNIIEVKNGHKDGEIDDAIDEAKSSKKPSIIIFNTKYGKDSLNEGSNERYNLPLTNEDINNLCLKYNINLPINNTEELKIELQKIIDKRLNKSISKWDEIKNESVNNLKLKEIIDFLETKTIKIDFNSDNFKLNDNYNEELILGNSKMFNIFASKSPFILSGSNDNFIYTKTNISKSDIMSKENKIGRNILFGGRTLAMGGIANGLASLGLKMFVGAPLVDSTQLKLQIKFSSLFNYPVNYIFTQDSFTNSHEYLGIPLVDEINSLRLLPNTLVFRPCDIHEIIGVYEILSNYKKSSVVILHSDRTPKLLGTNPKYIVAGAYRIRREMDIPSATLIATGSEVSLALDIANELSQYGIDLRVISMPCRELFENQNDRYKYGLIPKELKTFVLEFGDTLLWNKYATDEEYIFGINKFSTSGTKVELLNYYKLNKDNIKTRIIEILKK